MKAIKLLSIAIVLLIIASCSSVFSPVGDKTTDLNTKCDNCSHTRNYYKAYGEAEIVSGPRVKMAAISQARTYARNELVKMLGTEGMNIAAQIAETKTNVNQKGSDQTFKENMTQAFKEQAYAMLENTEDDCLETKLVKKSRKGQEYVVATVCIQMSKKEFADNVYRQNKEMFSTANIDYDSFSIILSGSVVDK
jgi:putative lipoic acid-binding regulatory protein